MIPFLPLKMKLWDAPKLQCHAIPNGVFDNNYRECYYIISYTVSSINCFGGHWWRQKHIKNDLKHLI